jgi:signal transduction histidine kinase
LRELIDDDELREMAEGIYRTSQRMVDTLSKILDITKIESEKIEVKYTEVNIRRLLEDICNEYYAAIKSKNLYLKKDFNNLPDKILSDEKLISEIISNLISNAIKFTSKGGIEIKAETRTKKQMNFLALSVSDTGIGIPREKIDLIWEEFRQVSEGSSRDFQGTGLGLTICKKYTELLGGKISVESEYGAGSTFLVEIPLL